MKLGYAYAGVTMFFVLVSHVCAQAQNNSLVLPGSAWNVLGNISPTEKGNIINASYVEQGIKLYNKRSVSFIPYISLGLTLDTKNYDWNNRLVSQVGVKLNRVFENGVVSVGTAYSYEYRWKHSVEKGAPIGYANYWFGWQQPSAKKRFPGSSWGIVGNISPVERGNVIAASYVQQGVTAATCRGVSLVPFAEGTFSGDSKRYDWNNRAIYGGGLKLLFHSRSGVVEIGSSYLHEKRFRSGLKANGLTFFLKLWFGWNPKIV